MEGEALLPSALILAFGLVLMVAVLVSELARRTVLSTSVIFLGAGFLVGRGGFGWVEVEEGDALLRQFSELALFAILFVDGTELPLKELSGAWRLPGRALLLGMPLTLGGIALAGRLVLEMTWTEALLVGAILSPTDPVLVNTLLEREAVPLRLRRLLHVESGLNDGIALPAVMVLLAAAQHQEADLSTALLEAAFGVVLGIAAPVGFVWLEKRSFLGASERYRPLGGIAVASVILGIGKLEHVNEFLGAFVGGVALASLHPDLAAELGSVGRPLAEALKLATLLVFGAMLKPSLLFSTGLAGIGFAVLTLLAARPLALVLALFGGGLSRKEWLAAAWFGPKGFASLLYALLMLHAGLPRGSWLFQAIAVVVVLSVLAHSSTDAAVARAFSRDR